MSQSAKNSEQQASTRAISELDSDTAALTRGITRALDAGEDSDAGEDRAIKLGLYWDEWARCIGSGYQSDSLYRYGRLDSCRKQWNDLTLAVEARLIQWRNPSRAKELIDSTYYKRRTTISPTAGAIWELKERPGWN
mmetsp:Transcript_26815/g.63026  ORF Transcript_26815/g.63026 Transcript_26815/m.63026 type:complete len:137 (+) Transcript_26815:49-459(+)